MKKHPTFIHMARKVVFMTCLGMAATSIQAGEDYSRFLRPAEVPQPDNNRITTARVELGKMLFFDPRLSGSNWISCGTCHNPALGWSDGLPTAVGHGMGVLERATPTILNTAYQPLQLWDGRARTLEQQALGPIKATGEMNQDLDEVIKELSALKGYRNAFEDAYPGEGITKKTLAKALATYERTIVSTEAPFDRWVKGETHAMSKTAQKGFEVFLGKGRCVLCHGGFNFTDNGFHNLGLKGDDDPGRYGIRKIKILKGAFKTPTLRDIELTAPYMHNGMYKTLEAVIDHYDRGGDTKDNLDPNMQPLHLNASEKASLVAFLKALTGEPAPVILPRLPIE